MHRPAQQALNARIVGELEKPAHHLQQMLADPPRVFRLAEPVTEHQRRFVAADQRHQRRCIKKFFLHEIAEIIGYPVLIARDNRRMLRNERQRNAAKQRHYREPVRQRTDHRRFGNSL